MNVYDFDDTILKGDSEYNYFGYIFLHYPKTWKYFLKTIRAHTLAKKGKISKEESRNLMYDLLHEFNKEERLAFVEKMWDKKAKNIKQFYLNQHRDDDVVISATPRFILEPIMRRIGVKHLIATEFDIDKLESASKFCWNEEKVNRFKQEYSLDEIDSFYSDSYSDQPMAKVAKVAIMVKGNKLLPWSFK